MSKKIDISKNYITIQGWMIEELNLKGNDLIVYAIIYGFCQQENHPFYGSLDYIAKWTNSTRQGIVKNINNLIEKGLIKKEEIKGQSNKYYLCKRENDDEIKKEDVEQVSEQSLPVNKVNKGSKQSLQAASKQSLQNNINNNINIDILNKLNEVCKTKFNPTKFNLSFINKLLKEGYSIDDFYKVIEHMYFKWGSKPFKFSNGQLSSNFLRPQTLFGDKFDTYLNEALNTKIERKNSSISCDLKEEKMEGVYF